MKKSKLCLELTHLTRWKRTGMIHLTWVFNPNRAQEVNLPRKSG